MTVSICAGVSRWCSFSTHNLWWCWCDVSAEVVCWCLRCSQSINSASACANGSGCNADTVSACVDSWCSIVLTPFLLMFTGVAPAYAVCACVDRWRSRWRCFLFVLTGDARAHCVNCDCLSYILQQQLRHVYSRLLRWWRIWSTLCLHINLRVSFRCLLQLSSTVRPQPVHGRLSERRKWLLWGGCWPDLQGRLSSYKRGLLQCSRRKIDDSWRQRAKAACIEHSAYISLQTVSEYAKWLNWHWGWVCLQLCS